MTGEPPFPDDADPLSSLAASLRAGAALFAAGRHRAAAEVWRAASARDPADATLLAGLAGYATAAALASDRDWAGATAAARRGRDRLDDGPALGDEHRGIQVGRLRDELAGLAREPVRVERAAPPPVAIDGNVPELDALTFPAAGVAARALAAAVEGPDADDGRERAHRETIGRAVAYASRDLAAGEAGSPFPGLVLEYLAAPRGIVLDRLGALVDRRARREADVDGLFEG